MLRKHFEEGGKDDGKVTENVVWRHRWTGKLVYSLVYKQCLMSVMAWYNVLWMHRKQLEVKGYQVM